jgi:hypothetical protein
VTLAVTVCAMKESITVQVFTETLFGVVEGTGSVQ